MFKFSPFKKAFKSNISGNIPVVMALSLVPVLGASGAAIDFVRGYNESTALRAAADNAVLAGTAVFAETNDSAKALTAAKTLFDQQLTLMPAMLTNTVYFTINDNKNGVSAKGTATLETTLMRVLGIMDMPLLDPKGAVFSNAEAPAPGSNGDVEISMLLDVTGSMCSDNTGPCTNDPKFASLKTAAKGLVDTVVWADQSKYTSKIAIVPFNTHVRIAVDGAGSGKMKLLTNLDPTWNGWLNDCLASSGGLGPDGTGSTWTCSSWAPKHVTNLKIAPCVTDRFYESSASFDYTDDAPGNAKWLNAMDGTRSALFSDSTEVLRTSGKGNSSSDLLNGWNYNTDGSCGETPNTNSIVNLTNSKTNLNAAIDGLQAVTSTGGVLGTAFAWYMLSPNWNSAISNNAQSYSKMTVGNNGNNKPLRKFAILMTDGAYNSARGQAGYQTTSELKSAAINMCSAMKAKGIEIYTVGYALNTLPVAEQSSATSTLQACGSDLAHFYQSFNASQLQSDFKTIASQIAGIGDGIRLTK